GNRDTRPATEAPHRALAAATERLATRDFADLSADELARLVELMRRLRLATPPRRTRRRSLAARGSTVDLRATLRQARRTGGHPVRLRRRRPRHRPRRLVVLCDISGSMAPYARAMLQLLYCAAGGAKAEVFTFATRLTRLTRLLERSSPALALERAGRAAPDWSGGTRIGATLKEFNHRYGARGVARGAVVLVISDGWDTGDPTQLGREMARLSRLAYRIVWANPRTRSARYRPLVGGMAAAWPYCDAVVSAHDVAALDDLVDALADPARRRLRSR
ncbi:MAG TPA: VWA domain-containing protein, partial [Jiangellales bacterium]|nr:VWA domain-containing protein [Jiangellales bacterium]